MRPRYPKLTIVVPVLFLLGFGCVSGCTSEDIATARTKLASVQQAAEQVQGGLAFAIEQKAAIDKLLPTLPAGSTRDKVIAVSKKLDAYINTSQDWLAKARQSMNILQAQLATATDTLDVVEGGVQAAAPLIPPPWGAVLAGVAGLVVGLIRAASTKKTAVKTLAAINPHIGPMTDADRAAVSAAQGAAGKKLVDEAQGKVSSLPI